MAIARREALRLANLQKPLTESDNKLSTALKQDLELWIANNATDIRQRDEAWYKIRSDFAGGSSMHKFCTPNGVRSFIRDRLRPQSFSGSLATYWGTLFEPVMETFIAHDLACKITATDSFFIGKLPHTSYSPDGLGVLQDDKGNWRTAVFEFKCPYSRTPDGKIKPDYLSQVKMGIELIEPVDIGLFSESVIRLCSWDDLVEKNSSYKVLTATQPRQTYFDDCELISCGCVGFYIDATTIVGSLDDKNPDALTSLMIDLGSFGTLENDYAISDLSTLSDEQIANLFYLFDRGKLKVWYSELMTDMKEEEMLNEIDKFSDLMHRHNLVSVGILPWKMLFIDYQIVKLAKGSFLPPKIDAIVRAFDIIKNNSEASDSDIEKILNENYPQRTFSDPYEKVMEF